MASLQQLREDTYLKIANDYYKDVLPAEIIPTLKKRYPPATVNRWLNKAQDLVCRTARCLYDQKKGTVAIGKYWIKLPDVCLDLTGVYFKEPDEDEIRLIPKSQSQLDEEHENWETSTDSWATNEPEFYAMMREQKTKGAGHSVKLQPRPDVAGTLKLFFIRLADAMTSAVNCSLDEYWEDALIDYAVYKAKGDVKGLQGFGALIQSMVTETKTKNSDAERFIANKQSHR